MALYNTAANLIPTMSSNIAPSGVASASSANLVTVAWAAFDHDVTSGFGDCCVWTQTTGWVQYQFDEAKTVGKYEITTQGYSDGPWAPSAWSFKGSNNAQTGPLLTP